MTGPGPTIAVIGGGLSGLTAAHTLRHLGARVAAYDAMPHPGGVARSIASHGYLAETGPHFMARTPVVSALIEELGLTAEVVDLPRRSAQVHVVHGGRLVALPMTLMAALTSPLLSRRAKLRVLSEPWAESAEQEDESVATYCRRRLGREVLDNIVAPLVGGWFGADPHRLSVRHALPWLTAFERGHGSLLRGALRAQVGRSKANLGGSFLSFRNGMQSLTDALVRSVGTGLHPSAAVTTVARSDTSWVVTAGHGADTIRRTVVDAVIYAGPAHAVRRISWPDTVQHLAVPVSRVRYAPMTVLTLGFRREHVSHRMGGLGVFVPEAEAYAILGALFVSSVFPSRSPAGHVTIACLVGGPRSTALAAAPPDTIRAAVIADLRRLIGVTGEPTFVHHATWPRAIPQYEVGFSAVARAVSALEAAHPGLYFCGSYQGGVGVSECMHSARALAHRVVAECSLDQRLSTPPGIVAGRIPLADDSPYQRPWPTSTSSPSPPIPTTSS